MNGDIDHNLINIGNYKDHGKLWKPYLVDDVFGLANVVARNGCNVQKITVVSFKNSSTEICLGWSCLGRNLKEDNKVSHNSKNKYVRDFIKKTIHGGKVFSCNQKIISKSFNEVVNLLDKFYGNNLEISELFAKYFKHIKAIKNQYEEKCKSKFSDFRRTIISKFEEFVDNKLVAVPLSKEISMIDKSDLLVSGDNKSLYPFAMAHPESKWLIKETAKAISQSDSRWICIVLKLNHGGNFKKSGFFKVEYYSPEKLYSNIRVLKKTFSTTVKLKKKRQTCLEMVI